MALLICCTLASDFIWDFRKLPFPSHLGKYFIKIGKTKCLNTGNWVNKGHFWIGMTPIFGLKNGQIKSLLAVNIDNNIVQSLYNAIFGVHRNGSCYK